jgi:hypothetical protein
MLKSAQKCSICQRDFGRGDIINALKEFSEVLNVWKAEGSTPMKTAFDVSFHVRVNSTNQLPQSMGVGRK